MSRWETIKSLITLTPDLPVATRRVGPDAIRSVELIGPAGQRAADWSLIRDGERVRDVWSKCSTAFACLSLLADAVAESPLRVYQDVAGEPEERPDHRARALLASPNPITSEAEFLSLLVMTMGLYGYGVVEKARSRSGLPVELWVLRPDWLTVERTADGGRRTVYRVPGRDPRTIPDDDLVVVPYYHDPLQQTPGLSPLQIVAREVGVDVSLTDLLKVFIDAGGIPPWAVEIPDPNPDQAKLDLFRLKWRERYGGTRAYSEIATLYGGMKLVKLGDSIGDMAWPELRSLTELKIAQAFRVPADLIQARASMSGGSLTTTEMDGAMRFLQSHGAQPLRMRIDGAFTRSLLPEFTGGDRRFSLEFDTSGILALQENRDALHARIRADWQAGLITLNEARVAIGRPDLGRDGEAFVQPFTTMLVPASELINDLHPMPVPVALPAGDKAARVYRDVKALSPGELDVRAAGLRTAQADKRRLEEIGARKLRAFFREQGRRIVAALPKSGPVPDAKAVTVDWDHEDELLRELLTRFYAASGERAFGSAAATVGIEIAWDLANPRIASLLDRLGQRIVGISETTRQDVARVITDGQAEGLTLRQISDTLTGLFEETYRGRAMTISRTETMASYGQAALLGYAESGVVDRVELSDNPDHTDPYPGAADGLTCAERHGLVVPLDRAEFHLMSDHPNGSATVIPILRTPLGEV